MDKTQRSIICDTCEKELIVDSSYPHRYALKLSAVDYGRNSSGMVYSVAMLPPLDRDYHFCGMKCLNAWKSESSDQAA